MIVSMVLNWIGDRTWVPMKEFIYQEIENAGIFTVEQAKSHYCMASLFRQVTRANEVLVVYKNLPDVWQVKAFDAPYRQMPYIELMQYGNDWLKIQEAICSWQGYVGKQRYAYISAVVRQRIKLYDLMDDLRRPHIPLYLKRIKLQEVKEMLGVENYEDIPPILPPVVPPEFIPNPQR